MQSHDQSNRRFVKDDQQYIANLKIHAEDLSHFINRNYDLTAVKSEASLSNQLIDPKEELKEAYSSSHFKSTPHFSDVAFNSPKQEKIEFKPISIALPKYEPKEEVEMID